MIHFDLAAYLLSIVAITDVVGDRIFCNRAPQNTTKNKVQPRIVYRLAAGSVRHYHTLGASGLVEADIVLGIVGPTPEAAADLYELIRNEVDGFPKIGGPTQWNGTTIDRATLTPAADGSGDPTQGDDTGYPAITATVEVFYQESIPALAGP